MTGTCHLVAGRRQALAAVSHADQSWIIASIASRRPEDMWSHVTRDTGETRNRCPGLGNTTAGEHEGPPASGRETKGPTGAGVAGVMRSRRPDVPPVRPGAARCSTGPLGSGP